MQINTTMRYHLTPVKTAVIKKATNNKCWGGEGERGIFLLCWWARKLAQPLWKTVWRFLKKLKIELPYDPAIALLGIYMEKIGFLGGSDNKESAYNAGDQSSIPGLGRSPGRGHGNPLQYSCLENSNRQKCLKGYSPWGCKESETTDD